MFEEHLHSNAILSGVLDRIASADHRSRCPRIGLFDSGVGGLSVLRALQREMPGADYIYLGDTARLPYGQRSPKTITDYSIQASQFLHSADVDAIVIACNTASSVALSAVKRTFPKTTVHGVVEAGAQAAAEATKSGRIAIIGTAGTVKSKAYDKAIARLNPFAEVHACACPFLVSLAEEGWNDCEVARMSVERYLGPLLDTFQDATPDCIILGCTHFSCFSEVIRQMVGPEVTLIDPADSLSSQLAIELGTATGNFIEQRGSTSFYATDALHRFARVGGFFLGDSIPENALQRVTLDNF